jgi:hypothetical protein
LLYLLYTYHLSNIKVIRKDACLVQQQGLNENQEQLELEEKQGLKEQLELEEKQGLKEQQELD